MAKENEEAHGKGKINYCNINKKNNEK